MPDIIKSGAHFSEDRKYRYWLYRIWDEKLPVVMCIGLNPSTANEEENDNTISILISTLSRLGYGGFCMTNLFAIISPDPKVLLTCEDPLGDNDAKLAQVRKKCRDVIVCWGNFKQAKDRIDQVLPNYPDALCYGRNKNGTPFHPRALVYIKNGIKEAKLIPYAQK